MSSKSTPGKYIQEHSPTRHIVLFMYVCLRYNVEVCIVMNKEHTSCNITIHSTPYAFGIGVVAKTLQTTVTMDADLAGRRS